MSKYKCIEFVTNIESQSMVTHLAKLHCIQCWS